MNAIYYIGLDIHKKTIAYCIKRIDGALVSQGTVAAERKVLSKWLAELPGAWYGAMEATILRKIQCQVYTACCPIRI
jgi:transposase